jgi:cytochrome c oxidase subunit IV
LRSFAAGVFRTILHEGIQDRGKLSIGQPAWFCIRGRLSRHICFRDNLRDRAIIALLIAFTKASLVVLFFMHVKYSNRMIALVVGCGLFFLSILIVLSCSDYITRRFS